MFEETASGQGRLSGKLDMNSSADLLATLTARVARAPLQLDLSGISEADSSAVALLLACRRAAEQAGQTLQLQNWPSRLSDLVELYALRELLSSPQGE
ncbi:MULTISPECIES: STAS domain-containing protein [Aquitalea]|jgi:phospholipid transport system transporter-binding protein|uniref:Phospholipid transport system transporter-binding protein n=1 Tax=Aquitalea magnusonii TaxID=332411 RepID=A0A318IY12_9NEIS|nr:MULTISPECIES: STAS domain-containing protein [Aquitalea]PXX39843.1 phospholipid transport system transporter-binding protein [Aquitalea magnusonii]